MSRFPKTKNNFLLYLAEIIIQESKNNKLNNKKYKSSQLNSHLNINNYEKSQKENYLNNENSLTYSETNDFSDLYNQQSDNKNYKRQYICHEIGCNKSYTSNHGLQYHKKNGHISKDESDKPFKCKHKNCGRAYKNVNGLKYHTRVEHDEL